MVTGAGRNFGDSRDSASSTTVSGQWSGQQGHRIPADAYSPFSATGPRAHDSRSSLDQTSQHNSGHRGPMSSAVTANTNNWTVPPTGPGEPLTADQKKPPHEIANVKMK